MLALQTGVAPLQEVVHVPHWDAVETSVSQPASGSLSQCAKPSRQVTAQLPASQLALEASTFGKAVQSMAQSPQWWTSISVSTQLAPHRTSLDAQLGPESVAVSMSGETLMSCSNSMSSASASRTSASRPSASKPAASVSMVASETPASKSSAGRTGKQPRNGSHHSCASQRLSSGSE